MRKCIILLLLSAILSCTPLAAAAEVQTEASVASATGGEVVIDVKKNIETIYDFLTNRMKLNSAAACGVLANIERESGFRQNALGDNGTSFGICQWHDVGENLGRWTNLKNFCADRGYDYTELLSQLYYLEYELQNGYPKVWNALYSAENTAEGAYEAAYYWCFYFEIPANREEKAVERGNIAKDTYWPKYNAPEPPMENHEVWIVDVDPSLNVRTGPDTTYPKSASLLQGTEIHVTEVVQTAAFLWGKIETGWCVLNYCKYVSGELHTVTYYTDCAVSIEAQPKSTLAELALSSSAELSKNGYAFEGWATEKGGEVVYPAEGGVYTGNISTTLYGVWTRVPEIALVAGDVDCDGVFTLKDVTVLLRHLAGYAVPAHPATSDVDGDGKLGLKDVVIMIRARAGWDVVFAEPVEPAPDDTGDESSEVPTDDTSSSDGVGEESSEGVTDTTSSDTGSTDMGGESSSVESSDVTTSEGDSSGEESTEADAESVWTPEESE